MDISEIDLGFIASLIFAFGCIILIITGHPEIFVSVFYGFTYWRTTVTIFGIPHTYVLLFSLLISFIFYLHKNKKNLFPKNNRWIILWVSAWWLWTLIVLTLFNYDKKINIYRDLLSIIIAPLPFLIMFSKDLVRIKRFAISFLITAIVGAFVELSISNISVISLLTGKVTLQFGILQEANYHAFSQMFMISILFIFALLLTSKNAIMQIILMVSGCLCLGFLLLGGSRQSVGGAIPPFLLFLAWSLKQKNKSKYRILLFGSVILSLAIVTLIAYPNLLLRSWAHPLAVAVHGDETIFDAFNVFNNRGNLWKIGFNFFLESPIWGLGYEANVWSHNFFIGILANEGIIGFAFMTGFMIFLIKMSKGFWKGSGNLNIDVWRTTLICIILYALITGMATGTQISLWHLWWAGGLLWGLYDLLQIELITQ